MKDKAKYDFQKKAEQAKDAKKVVNVTRPTPKR
jgi:hypothetical protein